MAGPLELTPVGRAVGLGLGKMEVISLVRAMGESGRLGTEMTLGKFGLKVRDRYLWLGQEVRGVYIARK